MQNRVYRFFLGKSGYIVISGEKGNSIMENHSHFSSGGGGVEYRGGGGGELLSDSILHPPLRLESHSFKCYTFGVR